MHIGTALEPGLGGERGQVSALGVLLIPFIKDPVSRAQGESLTSVLCRHRAELSLFCISSVLREIQSLT